MAGRAPDLRKVRTHQLPGLAPGTSPEPRPPRATTGPKSFMLFMSPRALRLKRREPVGESAALAQKI